MILFLNPAIFWSPVRQVLSYCSLYLELCPLRSFILWMMFFRLTPDKYISSGISLLSFLPSWSGTFWFSSFLMTVQFSLTMIYVSGLSCRKSDSYHCLILMDVILLSQWTHPGLSDFFHPFHVTFIYAMNWMIFLIFFCFSLVFFWWVYNSTRVFICQHFFVVFLLFLLYYI